MRWFAVVVCLVATGIVNAWEKREDIEGGAIFAGPSPVIRLQRQSVLGGFEVDMPRLSGTTTRFLVAPSTFLPGGWGGVEVYEGAALEDESVRVYVVTGGASFYAQVISPAGIEYIDPERIDSDEMLVKVYEAGHGVPAEYRCLAEPSEAPVPQESLKRQNHEQVIRTFRLAGAATAEFTEFHGSKEAALLSLVTALNRAHGIFEREVGVRFELAPQTETMIFEDRETDPYTTNEPTYGLLREAQEAFDTYVGSSNYDLGIVLTRGTYGLAYIRSVCDPARKGASCVGLPEPTGDAFHVNLVTHELAHQFGANHTFNSPSGLCGERRNSWTAFEPGAGSTIMSYSSLPCEGDSFQTRNDDYFHFENLKEIRTFLDSPGGACGALQFVENRVPIVTAPTGFHMPILTPFTLKASGSDPDGDEITYCWEEKDLGLPQKLGAPDNGFSPLFRSYPPTRNPGRTFPALPYILANEQPPFEQLPSTERYLRFRVTARDSRNIGTYSWADVQLGVINTRQPFRVTSHAEAEVLSGATTEVRWDVAGTTNAPISVTHVRILLSTDGGQSFGHVLADSTSNDGSEIVNLPAVNSVDARIKVEAIGNVFFNINQGTLTLAGKGQNCAIFAWERNEGGIQIRWTSEAGRTYRIERSRDLQQLVWETVAETVAQGQESSTTVSTDESGAGFFRVVQE